MIALCDLRGNVSHFSFFVGIHSFLSHFRRTFIKKGRISRHLFTKFSRLERSSTQCNQDHDSTQRALFTSCTPCPGYANSPVTTIHRVFYLRYRYQSLLYWWSGASSHIALGTTVLQLRTRYSMNYAPRPRNIRPISSMCQFPITVPSVWDFSTNHIIVYR